MWLLWSSPPGWVVSQLALLTSWRGWQQTREISVLFHPIKVTLAAAHSRCTQQISIFEACCSLMHMSITLFENGPCHPKLRPVKHPDNTTVTLEVNTIFHVVIVFLVIDHHQSPHKLYKIFIIWFLHLWKFNRCLMTMQYQKQNLGKSLNHQARFLNK